MPEGFLAENVANEAILNGNAPENLWSSRLRFEHEQDRFALPRGLKIRELTISDCPAFRGLPENLWAEAVIIKNCPAFEHVPESSSIDMLHLEGSFPNLQFGNRICLGSLNLVNYVGVLKLSAGLSCRNLTWPNSLVQELPEGLYVREILDLTGSRQLLRLPEKLKLQTLILRQCSSLKRLPNRLETEVLDISECVRLQWQDDALFEVTDLNLAGCVQIDSLPPWLIVKGAIDVANTGLSGLPETHWDCQLQWRGVAIDQRVAFHPEQIQVNEIFRERNAEVRRVMLERVGWERFFREAKPKVRDQDYDPGGERRLLHVKLSDEDLLVLSMSCPSTGRHYFIRVPPWTKTCHEAAAWMAGFDDPDEYEPVVET